MTHIELQQLINHSLAGEQLSFKEMIPHINYAIDAINTQLNTIYPTIELTSTDAGYEVFPDRYIRSVVVPGAVWHFYTVDEEGGMGGGQFQLDFQQGLFTMLRDFSGLIPEEYFADYKQGKVSFERDALEGKAGLTINNRVLF